MKLDVKNTDWPPAAIRTIAQTSGKPLEVTCARSFLAAGWKARLGSHFADGALDVVRELDVVAERQQPLIDSPEVVARVRALVSCRGFPKERSALVYSVSESSVPAFRPRLLSSHRAPSSWPRGNTAGPLSNVEGAAAERLLSISGLRETRPIVAFDMVERIVKTSKGVANAEVFERVKEGDRRLFTAADSGVKAAFYWVQEDLQQGDPLFFATLNVPVLVLASPFWDVCIDGGAIAEPEVREWGFQSNLYPARPKAREVLTVMATTDALKPVINALDDLLDWFSKQEATLKVG